MLFYIHDDEPTSYACERGPRHNVTFVDSFLMMFCTSSLLRGHAHPLFPSNFSLCAEFNGSF